MKIGLIGLGNMGYNLMLNLLDEGHEVVAWNRSPEKRQMARETSKALVVDTLEELVAALPKQAIVFSIISAGSAIDDLFFGTTTIKGLSELLSPGSIIVDLANSHYKDSVRRSTALAIKSIKMLDVGISGGISGARHGACFMVGGDEAAYDLLKELFQGVAIEKGCGYFGDSGAGHFVKMTHNAIEYGMMQSLAEGMSLISSSNYSPDLAKLLDVWNHGSIIQSNLVGYLLEAYKSDPGLTNTESQIGDLGTGKWAAQEALDLGVPFTSISHAIYARYNSRDTNFIGWKVIAAMRKVFGGHSSKDRPNI